MYFHKSKMKKVLDWRLIMAQLKNNILPNIQLFQDIIDAASQYFYLQSNIQHCSSPVTLVSDINAQFYQLIKIIQYGGDPQHTHYIFSGSYANFGPMGCHTLIILYALKICFPDKIILLRGCQQNQQQSQLHTFKKQLIFNYNINIYHQVVKSFRLLPLGCIVDDSTLILHGGICPELSIQKIMHINRQEQPLNKSVLCNILYADPFDKRNEFFSKNFEFNNSRGKSFYYNKDSVIDFLKQNNLKLLIRGHQQVQSGFKVNHRWPDGSPATITLYSSINTTSSNQKASIIKILNSTNLDLITLQHYPTPKNIYIEASAFDLTMPIILQSIQMFKKWADRLRRIITSIQLQQ